MQQLYENIASYESDDSCCKTFQKEFMENDDCANVAVAVKTMRNDEQISLVPERVIVVVIMTIVF